MTDRVKAMIYSTPRHVDIVAVCRCIRVLSSKFDFPSFLSFHLLTSLLSHVWSEKGERVISPFVRASSIRLSRSCVSAAMGHA